QRRVASVSKSASAALRQSSQRQGNCTKRSFGKCCHRRFVIESMARPANPPQTESRIHGFLCRESQERENQIAAARAPISVAAIVEASRLKRLCSGSTMW